MFELANETFYSFDPEGGVLWDLAFEPHPTVFLAHSTGKDSLGRGPNDGNGVILLVSALWPKSSSNVIVHDKAQEFMGKVEAKAKEMGLLKPFVYTNYANWSQRPLESYGKNSVDFLRRTARKYDPHGIFQRRVPGGFKLPKH